MNPPYTTALWFRGVQGLPIPQRGSSLPRTGRPKLAVLCVTFLVSHLRPCPQTAIKHNNMVSRGVGGALNMVPRGRCGALNCVYSRTSGSSFLNSCCPNWGQNRMQWCREALASLRLVYIYLYTDIYLALSLNASLCNIANANVL